jgi:hypothetical protein
MKDTVRNRLAAGESIFAKPSRQYTYWYNLRNVLIEACLDGAGRLVFYEVNEGRRTAPPAPTKETDSRTAAWNGLGQVELDAVDPKVLQRMATDAINSVFDQDTYREVKAREEEAEQYRAALKEFVSTL